MVHEENPQRQIILKQADHNSHNNNTSSIPPVHLWGEDALQSTFASIPSHLIILTSPGGRRGEYYYQHFTQEDALLWRTEGALSGITELVSGPFVATAQVFPEKYCHVNRQNVVPVPRNASVWRQPRAPSYSGVWNKDARNLQC